jgi:protein SCO1/2
VLLTTLMSASGPVLDADLVEARMRQQPGGEAAVARSQTRIPDVPVRDQNGRRLKFYTDLVKGKTVAINFIFTTCTTICPSLTATFRRVQEDLATRAPDVQLISISVDPITDTPERLRDFATRFKAGPGWTFVTGDKADIDSLLLGLGAATANASDHTPTILVSNDVTGYRIRTYGLASPAAIVKVVTDAASRQ